MIAILFLTAVLLTGYTFGQNISLKHENDDLKKALDMSHKNLVTMHRISNKYKEMLVNNEEGE